MPSGTDLMTSDGATSGGAIGDALRLPGERGGQELFGETDRPLVDGRGPMLLPDGFHGSSRGRGAGNLRNPRLGLNRDLESFVKTR